MRRFSRGDASNILRHLRQVWLTAPWEVIAKSDPPTQLFSVPGGIYSVIVDR
ncbi:MULTISPECIES: hypothetical protein [Pirellulaceae]|uniref:hypothetical protein n=1 Tax=Pirellulaceae TaxID=2691357 RepID=UPI001304B873|nr:MULTISPECIES: hypothetical protein [Pirellulaceae]